MSTVVSHPPGIDLTRLRQAILGSGLECALADCVPWKDLGVRLLRNDAELLVVKVAQEPRLDWPSLGEALALTQAPLIVVGPEDEQCINAARGVRAVDYIRESNLESEMPTAVERLMMSGSLRRERGSIVTVIAPTPGSGGSFVAANLAGVLAADHPEQIGLVELAHRSNDLAMLFNVTPEHTLGDVTSAWQKLDRLSLKNYFMRDEATGTSLLLNQTGTVAEVPVTEDVVRRIGLLSRLSFRVTMLALEGRFDAGEVEALRMSDQIVLVVRPDVPSVRRTQWALDFLREQGISEDRIRLVVNRWGAPSQLKLKQIEDSLGLKAALLLPEDARRVNRSINRGVVMQKLAPRCTICRRLREFANAHITKR